MPLTEAAAREKLHTRDIQICGYRRADGLYDIEAQLADAKSYGFVNQDRGYVDAGEKLHGMWLRLTVDETMTIVASEAATDHAPYTVCPSAAPAFHRLQRFSMRLSRVLSLARRGAPRCPTGASGRLELSPICHMLWVIWSPATACRQFPLEMGIGP